MACNATEFKQQDAAVRQTAAGVRDKLSRINIALLIVTLHLQQATHIVLIDTSA